MIGLLVNNYVFSTPRYHNFALLMNSPPWISFLGKIFLEVIYILLWNILPLSPLILTYALMNANKEISMLEFFQKNIAEISIYIFIVFANSAKKVLSIKRQKWHKIVPAAIILMLFYMIAYCTIAIICRMDSSQLDLYNPFLKENSSYLVGVLIVALSIDIGLSLKKKSKIKTISP